MFAKGTQMLTILQVNPPIMGAKVPVQRAADKLKNAAECASMHGPQHLRNRYIARVLPGAGPAPGAAAASLQTFIGRVEAMLYFGHVGDPQRAAKRQLPEFAQRAVQAGYDLESVEVQRALAEFLMLFVTEGCEGRDTTGTVTGNSQSAFGGHYDGTRAAPIIQKKSKGV
jgi:hypothetical protein